MSFVAILIGISTRKFFAIISILFSAFFILYEFTNNVLVLCKRAKENSYITILSSPEITDKHEKAVKNVHLSLKHSRSIFLECFT